MRVDRVCKAPSSIDIQIISTLTRITPLRISGHADDEVRCWNVGNPERTRTTDSHHAERDSTPHHPDKEWVQQQKKLCMKKTYKTAYELKQPATQKKKKIARTMVMTKTVASPWTATARATQATKKRKTGLNMPREVPGKRKKRCVHSRLEIGSRNKES